MKNTLSKFIQPAIALVAIALVVSVASAWTPPTGTFPTGNVPAPVNTGNIPQTKNANFSVVGNLSASSNVNGVNGFFSTLVNSAKGRFGCFLFTCSTTTLTNTNVLEAGRYDGGGNLAKGVVVSPDGLVSTKSSPLWIDLTSNTGSAGRAGVTVLTSNDNLTGGAGAVLHTTADKFSFWNIAGTDRVGLSAKKVQLTEGAAAGKVLVSDANGNGSWGDAAGVVDIIEVHIPISGQGGSASAKCPVSHPVALSAGGGCSKGMLSKVNVSFLGHANAQGQATIKCEQDPLHNTPQGAVDGIDLICAKAVPGGVYGGMVAGAQTTTTPQPPVSTSQFVAVPASTPNGTPGQSCVAWLLANNLINGNTQNVRFMGAWGGTVTSQLPQMVGACAYTATISGTPYCDAADALTGHTLNGIAYSPTAKCPTGSKLPVGGINGTATNQTTTLTGTTQTR